MIVRRNPGLAEELLDALTAEVAEDRSAQHPSVTDLVSCLTRTYLDWRAATDVNTTNPRHSVQTRVYFFVGLGLERALLADGRDDSALAGAHDGIYYHVDSIGGDGSGLFELKSTRANKKKFDAGEFPDGHVKQMKSYCCVRGVREIDYGVVFLIPGEFEVWRIEFTQEELDEHWAWMTARRDVWLHAMESGREPRPFTYNMDYECHAYGGCRWLLMCQLRASTTPRLVQ